MSDKFNCSLCGKCCMLCDRIPELKEYDRGNGVCRYLLKNENSYICMIYEKRPDICNVKTQWEQNHKEDISLEEYFKKSEEACRIIIETGSIEWK